MYEIVPGGSGEAREVSAYQEARSVHNATTVALGNGPGRLNIEGWREGEVDTARVLRDAQLNRFEASVAGLREELRGADQLQHKALDEIVDRVLNNLDTHFRHVAADSHDLAQSIADIAAAFGRQGNTNRALNEYKEALKLFREADDQKGEAEVLAETAKIRWAIDDRTNAVEQFQEALTLYRKLGDSLGEARLLMDFARRYRAANQKQRAIAYSREAVATLQNALYEKHVHEKDVHAVKQLQMLQAEAFVDQGLSYFRDEQWDNAADCFERALKVVRQLGDHHAEGQILQNLGAVYGREGQAAKAQDQYKAALRIFREIGDHSSEMSLNIILRELKR